MNAKKLLSTLLSAAMAVSMLAGCFGGGGNKNYSDEAADAANAAQSTVVFATDAKLSKSLQDALENFTQLDDIKDAMEADENLKSLLTSGYDLDVVAEQGEDAEAAAKAIAEKYILSIVSGKKAEGKIAMVLHDGNGYYYVAVLTYGSGGSGSGGGAGGGSGSGDDGKPGTGDDDDEENGVYDVDAKALDGNGTVKANKTTVKAGETVTITVTPKVGYQIDKIDYKGGTFNYVPTGSGSGSGSLVYTMSNVTGDVKFHVTFFEAAPDASTVTFTVTGEGTVTNTATGKEIKDGDTLEMVPADKMTFKVNPDRYYEAVVTNEGCTVVDNKNGTYTLSNVTDGATVTVTFEEIVYKVSPNRILNGRVVVNPSVVYPSRGEDSVTITLHPNVGYELGSIDDIKVSVGTVAPTGTDNQYIWSGITEDATVDVEFKKSQYEFTLNITGEGEVRVGDKTYTAGKHTFDVDAGETVSFEAVAGEHYEISSIKVDEKGQLVISEEFTVAADQAHTIDVAFAAEVYDVTITVGEGGTVNDQTGTVTGEITYGGSYTFTVEPEEGYEASIITNEQGSLKQGENGKYTLTGATGDVEISVKFKRTSYNINLTINGSGEVKVGSNTYTKSDTISVPAGQNATLTFTPDTDSKLVSVTVDGQAAPLSGNSCTVNAPTDGKDVEVVVTFEKLDTYTVTVEKDKNSTGDGTVNKLGINTVTEGGTFTFTAKPNDNKTTVKVTVDGDELAPTSSTANGNTYTISNINENKKVIVTFAKKTHDVIVHINEQNGTGTVQYRINDGDLYTISGNNKPFYVGDGDKLTIIISPHSNNTFTVDGATPTGNQIVIEKVTDDVNITITFTKKPVTVTGISIVGNTDSFQKYYWCTEDLDLDGLKIEVTYSDTTSETLTVTDGKIDGKDVTYAHVGSNQWNKWTSGQHEGDKSRRGWYEVKFKITCDGTFAPQNLTVYVRCNPNHDGWLQDGKCDYAKNWRGTSIAPKSISTYSTDSAQEHK